MQLAYLVPSDNVHAIREKLQVIMAVAEGPQKILIEQYIKEISGLLPIPIQSNAPEA